MRTAMGTYHLRPFGQPCIEGFFGGRFARALEDAGDGALAAQSIDEIVGFLGNDYRRKLKPLAESRWAHDPFARGSYSHALPGHAGAREVLAAPVDGRLFFAGEATSPDFFSTAHGARDSGERAAGEVLRRSQRTNSVIARSEATKQSSFLRCARKLDCFASLAMTMSSILLHHPRPHLRIRHEALLILPENPVPIARDETVHRVAQRLRHRAQYAHPAPSRQVRQHRQRCVGFEERLAAMDHGVGVGIIRVDSKRLRQPRAVAGLDRGEAESPLDVARATKRTQREQNTQTPS